MYFHQLYVLYYSGWENLSKKVNELGHKKLLNVLIISKSLHKSCLINLKWVMISTEFMSGQLDNPSSSGESYLSNDNDKPDLQKTLNEESRQRRLNRIRILRLKQALLKQIYMIVRLLSMMWLLLIWLNQIATVVCINYAIISIFLISSSYYEVSPFEFLIVGVSNSQTISEKRENNGICSTKLSKDQLCQQRRKIRIEKTRYKNKSKATSSLDNLSTSCVIGNDYVDNDIYFNMVKPIKKKNKKVCFHLFSFLIEIMC